MLFSLIPNVMIWAIYALYERISRCVCWSGGLSNCFTNTIGVKQACPLSPTLFGFYIDAITAFIARKGGKRVVLGGTQVSLLLYANDLVLLSGSKHDLQRHLNALDDFCTQRGLVMNLGKTLKVLIFHASTRVRTTCHLEPSLIDELR